MIETEDEPLTLPPLKWTYREGPEPSWRAEKYVISIVSGAAGDLIFSPYIVRFGQSETWHARTLVNAKETAERHRLRRERRRKVLT